MSRKNRNARRTNAATSDIGSQISQNTAVRMCTDTCGYEYGEALNRDRFIKKLRNTTYESLRDEARRQQRSSSDIAHALALLKAYNNGGRGALDTRALTMRD